MTEHLKTPNRCIICTISTVISYILKYWCFWNLGSTEIHHTTWYIKMVRYYINVILRSFHGLQISPKYHNHVVSSTRKYKWTCRWHIWVIIIIINFTAAFSAGSSSKPDQVWTLNVCCYISFSSFSTDYCQSHNPFSVVISQCTADL